MPRTPTPEVQFLVERLARLRAQYVGATPRQRLRVIDQRLDQPHANPNVLVTSFSAVEGLARSLVMNTPPKSKEELVAIYGRYRDRTASTLIEDYLRTKGTTSKAFFGYDLWATFKLAESYRNLLAHECTYLDNVKFEPLNDACVRVLGMLAREAGLRRRGHRLTP